MKALLVALVLLPVSALGQPSISGVDGEVSHGVTVTISGSNFGSKTSGPPLVWDDIEDGAVDLTATVGTWDDTGTAGGYGGLQLYSNHLRNANSSYNAGIDFDGEEYGTFQEQTSATKFFAQYWFYIDSAFTFQAPSGASRGNIKIFRLWGSASQNLRVQIVYGGESDLVVQVSVDEGHDWSPVVGSTNWVDEVLGFSAPGFVDPGNLGWQNIGTSLTKGSWHLFQFQYETGTTNNYDGEFQWWFDGKLIVDVDDVRTKVTGKTSDFYMFGLGWYNSPGTNEAAGNVVQYDDFYLDTTWARVELGNASTYAACTVREIQPVVTWGATIDVTVNAGSFETDESVYLFVVSDAGVPSAGFAVTIGQSGGGPTGIISPPTNLSVTGGY